MLRTLILSAIVALAAVPTAKASGPAPTPMEMRAKADRNMIQAQELFKYAEGLLQGNRRPSPAVIRTALRIFSQAGQLFEEARNIYQILVPNYAAPELVQRSAMAMDQCLKAIQELQKLA